MNSPRHTRSNILFLFSLLSFICQAQQPKHNELADLKNAIKNGVYPKIDGIIVQKSDKIVVEEYFGEFNRNAPHDMRSAFKSITSILTGIAIDQGFIKLDDKILKYFPDYKIKDENDRKKASITIKDLLEMKGGFDCEEFYGTGPDCEDQMEAADDWYDFAINVPMKDKPGVKWSYNSNAPILMGAIISRASGLSIIDFAKKYLFDPLAISDYRWTTSPKGQATTAGSFYIKPIDMLKIGTLVKQDGKWNENQVVSKNWIQQSTDCQIDIDFPFLKYSQIANAKYESARYGFYWYREKLQYKDLIAEVLFASGNGGQYIMILEEHDAVVVFTGSNYGNWRGKLPFEILLKYLIPILEDK